MIDKKTFVLAVAISWALTLVTVLLISNFAPSLTQPFTQQFIESNSVKVVTLKKEEIMNIPEREMFFGSPYPNVLYLNFTWTPYHPEKSSIMAIFCTFEYNCDIPPSASWEKENGITWVLNFNVNVDRFEFHPNGPDSKSARNENEWNQEWSSDWETTAYQTSLYSVFNKEINQNQNHYPIKLTFSHNGVTSTYIRNVNLMLIVIDG